MILVVYRKPGRTAQPSNRLGIYGERRFMLKKQFLHDALSLYLPGWVMPAGAAVCGFRHFSKQVRTCLRPQVGVIAWTGHSVFLLWIPVPVYSIPFHSIPFHSIPFHFHSIPFHPFHSIPLFPFFPFHFIPTITGAVISWKYSSDVSASYHPQLGFRLYPAHGTT